MQLKHFINLFLSLQGLILNTNSRDSQESFSFTSPLDLYPIVWYISCMSDVVTIDTPINSSPINKTKENLDDAILRGDKERIKKLYKEFIDSLKKHRY